MVITQNIARQERQPDVFYLLEKFIEFLMYISVFRVPFSVLPFRVIRYDSRVVRCISILYHADAKIASVFRTVRCLKTE